MAADPRSGDDFLNNPRPEDALPKQARTAEEIRQAREVVEELDRFTSQLGRRRYIIHTHEVVPLAQIPPRPWVAPPYLMRSQITLLHGPGAGGKSMLATAWAIALALGRSFGRLEPRGPMRVVLANFEEEEDEQLRRLYAALEYFGSSMADLGDRLERVSLGPAGAPIMFSLGEHDAVLTTECWEELVEVCEQTKPDVIIIDPFVAVNGVLENDNILIRNVMFILRSGLAQRFRAAVVLLHHDAKSANDDESSDQTNARGAGDIVNSVRFELAVRKMTTTQAENWGIDADDRGNFFRLGSPASKMNYSPPEASEWFERLPLVINNEATVRCLPWEPPSSRMSQDQEDTIIAAIERGTSDGPYSPQLGRQTARSLTSVFEAAGVKAHAAMRHMLNGLLNSGKVVKAEYRPKGRGNDRRAGLRSFAGLPYNYQWCDTEADP